MSALSTQLSHPKYRPDIDGLRAIAVLSVVAFHVAPNWVMGGFIGVDVFFVISGYLISTILFENLDKGTFSFLEFYSRRIKRIFPALLLVLISSYLIGWFTLFSDEYKQLGKHIFASASFVQNIILWNESSYFDNAVETKPLLHLWSLSVEEQFYLFWPILLWIFRKYNLLIATVLVFLLSFYLNLKGIKENIVATFYFPQTRFWELASGGMLAWFTVYKKNVFQKLKSEKKALLNIFSLIGMCLLVSGFIGINKKFGFPGVWALVPVGGAVFIIFAGHNAWLNRVILSNRIAVWFGLISYPLYLWHWPLLSFLRICEEEKPSMTLRIVAVLISMVLAWLTYEFVERSMRFPSLNRLKVISATTLILIIGYLGYCTYRQNGLPARKQIEVFEKERAKFSYSHTMSRNPKGAKLMLLGDSHADHLARGIMKELDDKVAYRGANGCIPFFNVDRYDNRFKPGNCRNSMNSSLSEFEKNKEMTGIILASMGPVYLTGEAFKGMDGLRVEGLGVTLSTHPEITDRWEIYTRGLRYTLERLTAQNKKILFVFDIPELGFDPRVCVANRRFLTPTKEVCAVSRVDYDQRTSRYRTLVYSVLKDFPKVKFYDPTNDFCDENYCYAFKEGKMLYRDVDHLSNDGSEFVSERMAPLLKELM